MDKTIHTTDDNIFIEHFNTLQLLSETTDDYLYMVDLIGEKMYFADQTIAERYDIPLSEEHSCELTDWIKIIYERDVTLWTKDIKKLQEHQLQKHDLVYRLREKNGNLVWISCRGTVLENNEGRPVFLMGRISDTALLGKVDALTCLFLGEEMFRNLREALSTKKKGVLMVFGVDHFKNINTKYGREFGDYLLKRLAAYLEYCVDTEFPVYRLDGDHFGVNFIGYSEEQATEVFEQIQCRLTDNCSVSAGAVKYPVKAGRDIDTLYNYAERSLDRAKQSGRNRLVFFSEEDYEKQLSEIGLTEELRKSVSDQCEGFYLMYQPQVLLDGFEVVGAEALLRFRSPYRGVVSPEQFIPILEQSGMIVQVGAWVLEKAIRQCAKWRTHNPKIRMSINLSYVQLEQKELCDRIFALLDQEGLPGSAIILEVTESMQLQDYPKYNQLFGLLGKRGIQISMDDFGTGYSSLGYLKSLDVDEIKIDRCFVSNIHLSAYNYKLLSNILELARSSKIRVVCEGVETFEELQTISDLEPDEIQGFYFSKPLENEEFEENYLLNHRKEEKWKADNKGVNADGQQGSIIDYKRILDNMDEVVIAVDMDTDKLCYMNTAAQHLVGVKEDYIGKNCYQVIKKLDNPCAACRNSQIRAGEQLPDFYLNECMGHKFLSEVKILNWGGHTIRFEVGVDMERLKLCEKNK